jgi:hypothetical protein
VEEDLEDESEGRGQVSELDDDLRSELSNLSSSAIEEEDETLSYFQKLAE